MTGKDSYIEETAIAIIPARGGSKGIPRKNLIPLLGTPMLAFTIRAAMGCARIAKTLVSTDDAEIANVARSEGALVVDRPPELARDEAPTEPAVLHAMDWWKEREGSDPDWVVLLQPTAPLRDSSDIDRAFTILARSGADCVLSVRERREFHWELRGDLGFPKWDIANRPRRQDLAPDTIENGAIYITRSRLYRVEGNRLGGKIALSVMPGERSVDVDEAEDIPLVEAYLRQRIENKGSSP
jgi:N-acylneuraminate cytidylyltransferase